MPLAFRCKTGKGITVSQPEGTERYGICSQVSAVTGK